MSHNFQAIDERLFKSYNTIIEMLDVLAAKVKNEVIEPLSRKDEAAYMNLAKINPKTTVDKLVKSIMQSFKTMVSIKNKLDKNPEAIKTTMQNIYNKVENHSRDMRMVRGF